MQKILIRATVLLLAFLCLGVLQSAAQAPNSISYQGRLTDTNGDAVTSGTLVIFSIYDALSGGSRSWIDTIFISPDSSGIFTVELASISSTVFQSGNKLYLQIEVLGDSPMTPRQLLTSAPYAYAAEMIADNSITAAKIATNAVGASEIAANAVGASEIASNAVTAAEIAADAVGSSEIATGAVGSSEIANNSIDRLKIIDECGAADSMNYNSYSLPTSTADIMSQEIDVPASGYVLAMAFGMLNIPHVYSTTNDSYGRISLYYLPGGSYYSVTLNEGRISRYAPSGTYDIPVYSQFLFPVSAGTFTVYLKGSRSSSVSVTIDNFSLILVYIPSNYSGKKSSLLTALEDADGAVTNDELYDAEHNSSNIRDISTEANIMDLTSRELLENRISNLEEQLNQLMKRLENE